MPRSRTEREGVLIEGVVDLSTCQNVVFEARNSVPGVKFEEEGRDSWVEVVRKRRKRMKKVTGG